MEPALLTHLRRGTLEFCVLAAVGSDERYAGDLIADLGSEGVLVTSTGTVYPLLARLRRQDLLASTWRESPAGPPRRYYRLTASGRSALESYRAQWSMFRDAVDRVLKTGEA